MPAPRPPPVPTIRTEDCADPERLARLLDAFARDVSAYARTAEDERKKLEARVKALEP